MLCGCCVGRSRGPRAFPPLSSRSPHRHPGRHIFNLQAASARHRDTENPVGARAAVASPWLLRGGDPHPRSPCIPLPPHLPTISACSRLPPDSRASAARATPPRHTLKQVDAPSHPRPFEHTCAHGRGSLLLWVWPGDRRTAHAGTSSRRARKRRPCPHGHVRLSLPCKPITQ